MKLELMKRLSELEARQHRATCPNGLAAFYADPEAMAAFYPDDPPPLPGDDD